MRREKEVYEKCPKCHHVKTDKILTSVQCDSCGKKVIVDSSKEETDDDERFHEITVHKKKYKDFDHSYKQYDFCCWKCLIDFVGKARTMRNVSFLSMPLVTKEELPEFCKAIKIG